MTEQYEKELREALEIEALPSDTDELIKLWEDRCEDHLRKYGRQVHHTLQEAAQTLADILPDLREMIEARKSGTQGKFEYGGGAAHKVFVREAFLSTNINVIAEFWAGKEGDKKFFTTAANNITKIADLISIDSKVVEPTGSNEIIGGDDE